MASSPAKTIPVLSLTKDQMQTLANNKPITVHTRGTELETALSSISRVKITPTGTKKRNGSMATAHLSPNVLDGFLYDGTLTLSIDGKKVRLDGPSVHAREQDAPLIIDVEWIGPEDGMRRSFSPQS